MTEDWEELINEGIEARKLGDGCNWRLGELAGGVEKKYGKNKLGDYADGIGTAFKSLQEYRRVWTFFCHPDPKKKKSTRVDFLTWAHHRLVAGNDDAAYWLAEAVKNKWSVEQLRLELRPTGEILDPPAGSYRAIVIDPPWPVAKIEREVRPKQGPTLDYPTLTVEELKAYRPPAAEDGAHIYLWTTHKFVPAAFELFEHWGVKYECLMTWVKPTGMTPYSWMYNTEHVLFGRIGTLKVQEMGIKLAFEAPVTRHSAKPDEFYDIVRRASPEPRLDMFARTEHEGFAGWGNELATG